MKLLYFAWVRDRIGLSNEDIDLTGKNTVADVLAHLQKRGGGYALALENIDALRVAVNQEFADLSTPVSASDEVAIFPPVTGG